MKLNKTKKLKRSYFGLVACIGVFLLLAVATVCPIQSSGANAAETETGTITGYASVYNHPVISVGIDAAAEVDITPKSTGSFESSAPVGVHVNTNNSSGYAMFIKSGGATADLVGKTPGNDGKIAPVSTNPGVSVSEGDFGDNTWGYNIVKSGDPVSTYRGMPTSAYQVQTGKENGKDNYDLVIGAKINTDLQADEYANSIMISVVANPIELTNMKQVSFMQDLTKSLCDASAVNDTTQMTDVRDGNVYWVTKLADGNCWMTQNLALDIDATKGLDASNTAIPENWNASSARCQGLPEGTYCKPKTTETEVPTKPDGSIPQTDTRSWNLGKYVLVDPENGDVCTAAGGVDQYDSVLAGGSLSECAKVGFIDVSGPEWKPTFKAQQGHWKYDESIGYQGVDNGITASVNPVSGGVDALIAVSTDTHEYDPHYLIGNYYQFNTATAGYGGVEKNGAGEWVGVQNTNVEYSICPKGWKLPLSGNNADIEALNNNGKSGSFYYMLEKYGLQSSVASGSYNIAREPLYFVRSGYIDLFVVTGLPATFGSHGYGLPSVAVDYIDDIFKATGIFLRFSASGVNPSYYGTRWYGLPVRCLVY